MYEEGKIWGGRREGLYALVTFSLFVVGWERVVDQFTATCMC